MFEPNVILKGHTHIMNNVCFQLLERDEFKYIVQLIKCLKNCVLLIFNDLWDMGQRTVSRRSERPDLVHIVVINMVNDVSGFGEAQDIENIREGDDCTKRQQEMSVKNPAWLSNQTDFSIYFND